MMDMEKENSSPNGGVTANVTKVAMVLPLRNDRVISKQPGLACQMHLLKQETFPCVTKSEE